MKVLVTGGAGYIGSHAVRKLITNKHEVVVLDDLSHGHVESLPDSVNFVKGDVGDEKILESLSKNKFDAVVHLAGFIEAEESVKNPAKYLENNYAKTLKLLDFCVKNGIKKIVFSSSATIYAKDARQPLKEDAKTKPENTYGLTKLLVEKELERYDREHGVKYAILRFFNASGADDSGMIGEDHSPETHLIPIVLSVALGKREKISIYGTDYPTKDGTCIRDYIHINDLADAHILALEKMSESKVFNVGTGDGNSVKEIIDICRQVTKHPIPSVDMPRRAGDVPVLVADSTKISNELGWKPKYDVKRIVETAWNWHRKHPNGFS